MITDSSLTEKRLKTRLSLTFRPKPERISDESHIHKVSLFVLTTSGIQSTRYTIEIPNRTKPEEHFFDLALTFLAIPSCARSHFKRLIAETKRRMELFLRPPLFRQRTKSTALDAQGNPHAAANAKRRQTALGITTLHFIEQRCEHARARRADRMPDRDCSAIDVDDIGIETEIAHNSAG